MVARGAAATAPQLPAVLHLHKPIPRAIHPSYRSSDGTIYSASYSQGKPRGWIRVRQARTWVRPCALRATRQDSATMDRDPESARSMYALDAIACGVPGTLGELWPVTINLENTAPSANGRIPREMKVFHASTMTSSSATQQNEVTDLLPGELVQRAMLPHAMPCRSTH